MAWRCVGCDATIPWDGKGLFSYTCGCGGTIFYNDQTSAVASPASLALNFNRGIKLPHLDSLVGKSPYTSPVKEAITKELLSRGFIWMKDCEQCRQDGTLERALEREKARAILEAERILRMDRS